MFCPRLAPSHPVSLCIVLSLPALPHVTSPCSLSSWLRFVCRNIFYGGPFRWELKKHATRKVKRFIGKCDMAGHLYQNESYEPLPDFIPQSHFWLPPPPPWSPPGADWSNQQQTTAADFSPHAKAWSPLRNDYPSSSSSTAGKGSTKKILHPKLLT